MNLPALLLALLPVLSGPDGRLQVHFSEDGGALRYSIAYDGRTLVEPSRLGLQTNDADYTRLEAVSSETQQTRDTYVLDRIKVSRVDHPAVRAVLHCKNPQGRPLDIEWHLTANDAAFRYLIPKDTETGSVRVLREASFHPNVRWSSKDELAILAMVRAGLGVSVMPGLYLRESHPGVVVLPLRPRAYRQLGASVPSLKDLSPAAKRFLESAKQTMCVKDP